VTGKTTLEEARAAKQKAYEAFRACAKVAGVGISRIAGGYGVKVNLEEPAPEGVVLPDSIDGVPVRVEVVGKIRKL
jgi:hypothetical protein